MYFTVRWWIKRNETPHRLDRYLARYKGIIYALSIITGFYATIDFLRSKLFYLNICYLPLTKDEYEAMSEYRFITVVVLEVKSYAEYKLYRVHVL